MVIKHLIPSKYGDDGQMTIVTSDNVAQKPKTLSLCAI